VIHLVANWGQKHASEACNRTQSALPAPVGGRAVVPIASLPIRTNLGQISLQALYVHGVHSSDSAAKVIERNPLAAFTRHERQWISVRVVAANPPVARSLGRAEPVPKRVKCTKSFFDPVKFGERPHIVSERSHAESFLPEMDRFGVGQPQEQCEHHPLVVGENGHSVLPEHLAKVKHGLVESRRAAEVADREEDGMDRVVGNIVVHVITTFS
jgi:hypothetical protein